MELSLFSMDGLLFVLRWMHFFAGVIWIGHLYYFNFTQGGFMAETDAPAKSQVLQKLLPRALWWFRWAALWTAVTGLAYIELKRHQAGNDIFSTSWGASILIGATLALVMFANVWLIIWPNQKIVIANAVAVAGGAAANPAAAGSAAKALLASRTNTMLSIPMLFLMGAASHLPISVSMDSQFGALALFVVAFVVAVEANAIKGKLGYMTTVKGVITVGFLACGLIYAVMEALL